MDCTVSQANVSKRGSKGKFTGFKLAFLHLLASEYEAWRVEGRSGSFYDYATRRFLRKYGTGDFHLNPAEDEPEADVDDDEVDSGCTTEPEAVESQAKFDELRGVSIHCTLKFILETHQICRPDIRELVSSLVEPSKNHRSTRREHKERCWAKAGYWTACCTSWYQP